jgi:competence protein ComEC
MRRLPAVFILSAIFLFSCGIKHDFLKIHFIDARGGSAVLIQTPGGENILVDSGDVKESFKVAGYLRKEKIGRIDHLILTHPHIDHFGGAFMVLKSFDVANVYDNGLDSGDITAGSGRAGIAESYRSFIRGHVSYKRLKRGDYLSAGGVRLDVLWPPEGFPARTVNDTSLVIMVSYGKTRLLLTSDITADSERRLLLDNDDLKCDILQVSHHASIDASCAEFLEAAKPGICVITADKGMASSRVVKRIKGTGCRIFNTGEDGNITISVFDGGAKAPEVRRANQRL